MKNRNIPHKDIVFYFPTRRKKYIVTITETCRCQYKIGAIP